MYGVQLAIACALFRQKHAIHCIFIYIAGALFLNSSLGTGRACPDEMVTYTCIFTEGTFVRWSADPSIPNGADIVYSPMKSTLTFNFITPLNGTIVYCIATDGNRSSTLTMAGTL